MSQSPTLPFGTIKTNTTEKKVKEKKYLFVLDEKYIYKRKKYFFSNEKLPNVK